MAESSKEDPRKTGKAYQRAVTPSRAAMPTASLAWAASQQPTDGRPARIEDFTSETVVRFVKASMEANEAGRNRSLTPPPHCIYMETACIFADVSGFTRTTEILSKKGTVGAERMYEGLNKYISMLSARLNAAGADIVKFAGDALLCIWPPSQRQFDEAAAAAYAAVHRSSAAHGATRGQGLPGAYGPPSPTGVRGGRRRGRGVPGAADVGLRAAKGLAAGGGGGRRGVAGSSLGDGAVMGEGAPLDDAQLHSVAAGAFAAAPSGQKPVYVARHEEGLMSVARRAVECGVLIQQVLDRSKMGHGIEFSVKVGVGVGRVALLTVGGIFHRKEYLVTGPALAQAFRCEGLASAGWTVVSPPVWNLVHPFYLGAVAGEAEEGGGSGGGADGEAAARGSGALSLPVGVEDMPATTRNKFIRVIGRKSPAHMRELVEKVRAAAGYDAAARLSLGMRKKALHRTTLGPLSDILKQFAPAAVVPQTDLPYLRGDWIAELRTVTVVFASLGIPPDVLSKEPTRESQMAIHEAIRTVQKSTYQYEGSLNKFLIDDKGATILMAWGLPPLAHEDDPERAVMSSMLLVEQLAAVNKLECHVGITTGLALCGPVGNAGSRREYTVLGNIVNMSARLMATAKKLAGKRRAICDEARAAARQAQISASRAGTAVGASAPEKTGSMLAQRGGRAGLPRILAVDTTSGSGGAAGGVGSAGVSTGGAGDARMDAQNHIVESIARAGRNAGGQNLPNLFARAAAATLAKARLRAIVRRRRQRRSEAAAGRLKAAGTADKTPVSVKPVQTASREPRSPRVSVTDDSDPIEQAASRAMWDAALKGQVLADEAPFQGCILMDQATRNAMEASQGCVLYQTVGPVMLKGMKKPARLYQPYSPNADLVAMPVLQLGNGKADGLVGVVGDGGIDDRLAQAAVEVAHGHLSSRTILLTGQAGSGRSVMLRYGIRAVLKKQNVGPPACLAVDVVDSAGRGTHAECAAPTTASEGIDLVDAAAQEQDGVGIAVGIDDDGTDHGTDPGRSSAPRTGGRRDSAGTAGTQGTAGTLGVQLAHGSGGGVASAETPAQRLERLASAITIFNRNWVPPPRPEDDPRCQTLLRAIRSRRDARREAVLRQRGRPLTETVQADRPPILVVPRAPNDAAHSKDDETGGAAFPADGSADGKPGPSMASLELYEKPGGRTTADTGSSHSNGKPSASTGTSAGSHSSSSSRKRVKQDARDFPLFGPMGRGGGRPGRSSGTAIVSGSSGSRADGDSSESRDRVEALFNGGSSKSHGPAGGGSSSSDAVELTRPLRRTGANRSRGTGSGSIQGDGSGPVATVPASGAAARGERRAHGADEGQSAPATNVPKVSEDSAHGFSRPADRPASPVEHVPELPAIRVIFAVGVNRVLLRKNQDGFVMRQVVHQLCMGYPRCYHNRDWVEVRGLMQNVHQQRMFMQPTRKEAETRTLLRLIDLHCRHVPVMMCIDDLHQCTDKDWHLVLAVAQYIHQANQSKKRRPPVGAASVVYGSTGLRGSGSMVRSVGSALSSAIGRSQESKLGFDSVEKGASGAGFGSAAAGLYDSVASTAQHDFDETPPIDQEAAGASRSKTSDDRRGGRLSPLVPSTPRELEDGLGESFEQVGLPGAAVGNDMAGSDDHPPRQRSPRAALHARIGLQSRPRGRAEQRRAETTHSGGQQDEIFISDGYRVRSLRCLLVVGTRPLHMPRYWPVIPGQSPPPPYFGLLGLLGVEMWNCPSLNPGLTSSLIAHYLGVPPSKVPTILTIAVHTMAGGTPKGVRKLIHALHSRKRVRIEERRHSRGGTTGRPGSGEDRGGIPAVHRTSTAEEPDRKSLLPSQPHREKTFQSIESARADVVSRHVKVDLNGLYVLPLPNWAQRVVAEALDRATPAAIVIMKVAAILAVGGGAWCLHFAPLMLLDLHPSVQASSLPAKSRSASARDRLQQHVDRFGKYGDGDGDSGGRSGSGPVRPFSVGGNSARHGSGRHSLASSRGSHAPVSLLEPAVESHDIAPGLPQQRHRGHHQPVRMKLWQRLTEAETSLVRQRAVCDSLFDHVDTDNPTATQRKRFKSATLANVDVRKVLEELLKLGILQVAAVPNTDQGDASALHEEDAARALKRLKRYDAWHREEGGLSSSQHPGIPTRSNTADKDGPARPNPRTGKVRSNSLRQRALRPPPLSTGGGSRSTSRAAQTPAGNASIRMGGLLQPDDYVAAGAVASSDEERASGPIAGGPGTAVQFASADGGGGGIAGIAERRYLALRVTARSAEATHRGAQLVQQADTAAESGFGSKFGSSAGSDSLSAGALHRDGLFASGSTIRDRGDASEAGGGSWTTTEAGAADVDIDRLITVLWPSESTGDPLENAVSSHAEAVDLPSSEPSESSMSEASSGYSTSSSRPASVMSRNSGFGSARGKAITSPPQSPRVALGSGGSRARKVSLPRLQVPGNGTAAASSDTPAAAAQVASSSSRGAHTPITKPAGRSVDQLTSLRVSEGRGSLVRGLLRGQAAEEVTLQFTDGFMRDIVYHRTMHVLREQLHARAATSLQRLVEEDEARRTLHAIKLTAVTKRSGLARRAAHIALKLGETERSKRLSDEWQACRVLLASLLANPWRPLLPVFLRTKRERDKQLYRHLMFGGRYEEAERHYKTAFEKKRRSGSVGRHSDASSHSRDDDARSQASRKLARKRTRISLMAGLQSTNAATVQAHHNGEAAPGARLRRGSLSKHVSDATNARVAVEVVYSAVLAADEAARTARRASGDGDILQLPMPHGGNGDSRQLPSNELSRSHAIVPFQTDDGTGGSSSGANLSAVIAPRGGHLRSGGSSVRHSTAASARSHSSNTTHNSGKGSRRHSWKSGKDWLVPRDEAAIAAVDQMETGQPLDWRGRMRQDLRGRFIQGFGHRTATRPNLELDTGAAPHTESTSDVFRSLRDGNLAGRRSSAPSLEHNHSLQVAASGPDLLAGLRKSHLLGPGSGSHNALASLGRKGRSSLPQMPVFLQSPASASGLPTGGRRLSQPLDTIKEGVTPAKQRTHDVSLLDEALKDAERVSSDDEDDDDDDDDDAAASKTLQIGTLDGNYKIPADDGERPAGMAPVQPSGATTFPPARPRDGIQGPGPIRQRQSSTDTEGSDDTVDSIPRIQRATTNMHPQRQAGPASPPSVVVAHGQDVAAEQHLATRDQLRVDSEAGGGDTRSACGWLVVVFTCGLSLLCCPRLGVRTRVGIKNSQDSRGANENWPGDTAEDDDGSGVRMQHPGQTDGAPAGGDVPAIVDLTHREGGSGAHVAVGPKLSRNSTQSSGSGGADNPAQEAVRNPFVLDDEDGEDVIEQGDAAAGNQMLTRDGLKKNVRLTIGANPQSWTGRTAGDGGWGYGERPNTTRGGASKSNSGSFTVQMAQLGDDSPARGRGMRAVHSFHPRMVGAGQGGAGSAKVHPMAAAGRSAMRGGALDRRMQDKAWLPAGTTAPERPLAALAAEESDAMRSMAALAGRSRHRQGSSRLKKDSAKVAAYGASPAGSEIGQSGSKWGMSAARFDASHKNLMESQWLFVEDDTDGAEFPQEGQEGQAMVIEMTGDQSPQHLHVRDASADSPQGMQQLRTLKHAVSSYGGGQDTFGVLNPADSRKMFEVQARRGNHSARGSIAGGAPVLPRRISNAAVPLMGGTTGMHGGGMPATPRMPLGAAFGTPRGAGSLDREAFGKLIRSIDAGSVRSIGTDQSGGAEDQSNESTANLSQLAAVVSKINTWQFDSWAAEEWSAGGCALLPTFMAVCEAWQLSQRLGIPRQAFMQTAMRLEDLSNAVGTKEGESMASANDRQARSYASALRRRSRASVAAMEHKAVVLAVSERPGVLPKGGRLPPLERGGSHRQSVGADPASLDTAMAAAHRHAFQRGKSGNSAGSADLDSSLADPPGHESASGKLAQSADSVSGQDSSQQAKSPPPFLPMDFLARSADAYHGSKKAADAVQAMHMLLSTPELRVQMMFKPLEVLAMFLTAAGTAIVPAITKTRKRRFSARSTSLASSGTAAGTSSSVPQDSSKSSRSTGGETNGRSSKRQRRRTVWMAGNSVTGQNTSSLDAFVAVFESTYRGQILAALGPKRSRALLKWVRSLSASRCPDPLDWVASSDRLAGSRNRMRNRSSRAQSKRGGAPSLGGRSASGLEGVGEGGRSMRTARREARRQRRQDNARRRIEEDSDKQPSATDVLGIGRRLAATPRPGRGSLVAADLSAADHAADRARRMAAKANRIRVGSPEFEAGAANGAGQAARATMLPSTPPAGGGLAPPAGGKNPQSVFSSGFAMALEEEEQRIDQVESARPGPSVGDTATGPKQSASAGDGPSSGEKGESSSGEQEASDSSAGKASALQGSELLLVSTDEALDRMCKSIGKLAKAAAKQLDEIRDEPQHMQMPPFPSRHDSAPSGSGLQRKHTPIHLDAATASAHPLLQVLHKRVESSHRDLKRAADEVQAKQEGAGHGTAHSSPKGSERQTPDANFPAARPGSPMPPFPPPARPGSPMPGAPPGRPRSPMPTGTPKVPVGAGRYDSAPTTLSGNLKAPKTVEGLVDPEDAPVLSMPSHEIIATRCLSIIFRNKHDRALLYRALMCLSLNGEVFRDMEVSRRWALRLMLAEERRMEAAGEDVDAVRSIAGERPQQLAQQQISIRSGVVQPVLAALAPLLPSLAASTHSTVTQALSFWLQSRTFYGDLRSNHSWRVQYSSVQAATESLHAEERRGGIASVNSSGSMAALAGAGESVRIARASLSSIGLERIEETDGSHPVSEQADRRRRRSSLGATVAAGAPSKPKRSSRVIQPDVVQTSDIGQLMSSKPGQLFRLDPDKPASEEAGEDHAEEVGRGSEGSSGSGSDGSSRSLQL